jgi:hypothetical protein
MVLSLNGTLTHKLILHGILDNESAIGLKDFIPKPCMLCYSLFQSIFKLPCHYNLISEKLCFVYQSQNEYCNLNICM